MKYELKFEFRPELGNEVLKEAVLEAFEKKVLKENVFRVAGDFGCFSTEIKIVGLRRIGEAND